MITLAVEDNSEKMAIRTSVRIKTLVKQFRKGINTFEVATTVNGSRVAAEVTLEIQI